MDYLWDYRAVTALNNKHSISLDLCYGVENIMNLVSKVIAKAYLNRMKPTFDKTLNIITHHCQPITNPAQAAGPGPAFNGPSMPRSSNSKHQISLSSLPSPFH